MTPAQGLLEFRASPRKWLEQHHLITSAGVPDTFSAQQHFFGNIDTSGGQGPVILQRTVATGERTYGMHYTVGHPRFLPGRAQASVMHVPVIRSNALNGYAGLALHDLGNALGRDFMVTTLLNGCSFVVHGENPSVLHVQPTGGLTAPALRTALAPHYDCVFGGGVLDGGRNGYNDRTEDVTVIGVRSGKSWKIYAQVHGAGEKNVLRVRRIFPGE